MSTLTIQIPDSLMQQLREYAAREGISVDQLLASAAAEKLSALMTLDHLRERARKAKKEDLISFLEDQRLPPQLIALGNSLRALSSKAPRSGAIPRRSCAERSKALPLSLR